MAQYVEAYGQTLEFPDGMSESDMAKAIKKSAISLSPSYERGRKMNDSIGGAALQGLASVAQGPTFGFADEIGGAVGGVASMLKGNGYGSGYRDTRDMLRGAADQQQEENPWTTGITRGMAALPAAFRLPAAAGRAAVGAVPGLAARYAASPMGSAMVNSFRQSSPMLSNILGASGVGVASGALDGIGSSKQDSAAGIGQDAGRAAMIGAIAPFGLVPAFRGAAAVAGNVASRFSQSAAMRQAQEKVAEAFTRDTRGNAVSNPIPQAEARLRKLGPEASIADSGGTSVRSLLDTLATLPGETKDAVERMIHGRQASRATRMIGAADDALGAGGARLSPTLDRLIADRRTASAPLYKQALAGEMQADPIIIELVQAANSLGANKLAKQIAAADMAPFTLSDAEAAARGAYSMRDLHYLKMGIDDLGRSSAAVDPKTGNPNALGNAVGGLRDAFLAKMDEASGGLYAQARAAYAGPSAVMDAARAGRKAMSSDDMAIRKLTDSMGQSELEGFRIGAFEALRAKLGKESGQTEILKMWKEPATREKLQAIFPDERSFREFASRTAGEARLKALESTGRGSQTASRQYGAGDLDAPAIKSFGAAAVDMKTGNVGGLFDKATSAWNRVSTPEPVRDAMGRILLSRGDEARGGLLSVQQIAQEVATNRRRQSGALGLLGGNLLDF